MKKRWPGGWWRFLSLHHNTGERLVKRACVHGPRWLRTAQNFARLLDKTKEFRPLTVVRKYETGSPVKLRFLFPLLAHRLAIRFHIDRLTILEHVDGVSVSPDFQVGAKARTLGASRNPRAFLDRKLEWKR